MMPSRFNPDTPLDLRELQYQRLDEVGDRFRSKRTAEALEHVLAGGLPDAPGYWRTLAALHDGEPGGRLSKLATLLEVLQW